MVCGASACVFNRLFERIRWETTRLGARRQCSGCGVSGWGWRDERWGSTLKSTPVLLRFPTGGWQHVRIQTREDGVSIDQIVLSSERYLNAPPGPAKRDDTLLPPKPY